MVRELQRELFRHGLAGCLVLFVVAAVFFAIEGATFALRFLLFSLACWAYVCRQCWTLLALNSPDYEITLYPTLGHANLLTLLRAFLIACTAGFLFNPFTQTWLGFVPAVLYTVAAICDRIDGYLARRQKQTTLLGRELDTIIDALGLVVAPLLAVLYGKAHVSYLLVSAAWYLFSWGQYWRRRYHKPTYPLLPSKLRRTLAGFQMGFVAGALWPPLDPQMTQLFGVAFMLPLLAGFWVDWLVVSGRIDTRAPHAAERFLLVGTFVQRYVMPALRLLLVALLWPTIQQFSVATMSMPVAVAAVVLLVCVAGTLLGFLGRACATVLMLLLCWFFSFPTMDSRALSTIGCIVLIILLGTGRHSLRNADETWINRQDGA